MEHKFNNIDCPKYTRVYQYCNDQPVHVFEDIKYVVIKKDEADKLEISNKHAKISIKDPMLKNVKGLLANDVIAVYRDYELNVSPYYAIRIITA